MKTLKWLGSSYKRLLNLPRSAIRQVGYQLGKVQRGEQPADWKPMQSIGPGAIEIRIHEPSTRVIYVAKFSEAIYVLHCFEKKTPATSKKDLAIARNAYAEIEKMQDKNG